MVVLTYINKMMGRIPHLAWLACEIHEVVRDLKAEMKAVYIQQREMKWQMCSLINETYTIGG